jgi:uncharacterized membrane protein YfcA
LQDLILLSIALLSCGCIAGVMAGLLGVGGGIVIVPVMELALSFVGVDPAIRMHIAVATSLAIIIPTSISSARAHHARGAIDFELVRRWAQFVLIGAVAGTVLATQVHSRVLAAIFGGFALLIGLKMSFRPDTEQLARDVPHHAGIAAIPAAIGFFSSMMGIGGGTFSVMIMSMFGKPIHTAVGTASLFGLVIAVPGTLGYVVGGWHNPSLPAYSAGFVSLLGFAFIAPTTALAAPLGARIAHGLSRRHLQLVFGVFLLIASARMIGRAL